MTDPRRVTGEGVVSYPEGRYGKYEKKIDRVAAALAFVKKHKLPIGISAVLFLTVLFVFLYFVGSFYGGIYCEDYTYGETPRISASAFCSGVEYEYSRYGGDDWTAEPPIEEGRWEVRAFTTNPFGMRRYTESGVFSVYARDLEIIVDGIECVWGEYSEQYLYDNLRVYGLADTDTITDVRFDVEWDGWSRAEVRLASYRIENPDGEDVSAGYDTEVKNGTLTVEPRPITLTTSGGQKVYDAEVQSAPGYTVGGSLAHGDRLEISFDDIGADAGTYSVSPTSLAILSSDGTDVTERYDIKTEFGVYVVYKRALTFKTESAKKVYDGTPLTADRVELIAGEYIPSHTYRLSVDGEITAVGEKPNYLKVSIFAPDGRDVTHNYDISAEHGILKVTPILLKFTTSSAEKIYDGTPLTSAGYSHVSGETIPSHRLTVRVTGARTDAGESDNTLYVSVSDAAGRDVTEEGYSIEVECGTLRVLPRPVEFTSLSASKYYDGKPLTRRQMAQTAGKLVPLSTVGASFTGSQTEVGKSDNTFTVRITDSDGNDTTQNYDISYVYGVLEVLESDLHGGSQGGSQGGEHGGSQGGITGGGQGGADIGAPEMPDQSVHLRVKSSVTEVVYFRAFSYGDYNGSGFDAAPVYSAITDNRYISSVEYIARTLGGLGVAPATVEIELLGNTPMLTPYYSEGWVKGGYGESDVGFDRITDKYTAQFYNYSLDNALRLQVTALEDSAHERRYRDFVYDTYLQIPDSTKKELLRIAEQNGFAKIKNTKKLVEAVQAYIQSAARYNLFTEAYPDGVDTVLYFLEESKQGVCSHFASAATMMFRALGLPARYTTGYMKSLRAGELTDITGMSAHAWVEVYVWGVGWIPVEVTGGMGEPGGTAGGGGGNQGSTFPDNGKQNLAIIAYGAVKEYDGQPFDPWNVEKYNVFFGSLKDGHTLEVEMSEEGYKSYLPGVFKNSITSVTVRDADGRDVTNEYNIATLPGEMVIMKRRITVMTGSATDTIANGPLSCEEMWVISGSLLGEHELHADGFAELYEIGSIGNSVKSLKVLRIPESGKAEDVTDYYDITVREGTLTLTE